METVLDHPDFLPALTISGIFGLIFVMAEFWRVLRNPPVEWTRKFVHLTAGAVALSFAHWFSSHWTILILCILFVSIILVTRRIGWLQSVHAVNRHSHGGIYYPIAVYASFFFASSIEQPVFYVIAISVLAVSDSLAALIGKSYGMNAIRIEEESKSVEGTTIFFLVTFLIVHLCLLLLTDMGRWEVVLTGVYVALLVTAFELISLGGADNIFIPLGTLYILNKYPNQSIGQMESQLLILLFVLILTWALAVPTKKLGISATVGLATMGYAAWGLVDFHWFIPVVTTVILVGYLDLFLEHPTSDEKQIRIRTTFYVLGVAAGWVLLVNLDLDNEVIYLVPFLFNFISNLNLMWMRKKMQDRRLTVEWQEKLRNWPSWARISILILLFIPIQTLFLPQVNLFWSMMLCFAGTTMAEYFNIQLISSHAFHIDRLTRFRIGMVISLLVSILIFGVNTILWHFNPPFWRI